jgi:HptB-dependent secretion and biofilm anti anti-sigma factor
MPHSNNTNGAAMIIHLPARFGFSHHHRFFKDCTDALAEKPNNKLTLDFSAVKYIDSAAIGMIINFTKKAASQGVAVNIANSGGSVADILQLIRFDEFLAQQHEQARARQVQ